MEFLTSGVFWTGLAGIVATAVTAVVGQVAQSRRHLRELRLQRRRHRYDELRVTYERVLDMVSRVTGSAGSPAMGRTLIGTLEAEQIGRLLSTPGALEMVRASDDVKQARRRLGAALRASQAGEPLSDEDFDRELRESEKALERACADHLAEVWPLDPKD